METRTIYIENEYEPFITVSDELKLIVKMRCLCTNFQRGLRRIGKVQDIKVSAEPCPDLVLEVNRLISQGYTFKTPTENIGLDKLTPKLRREILAKWENKCAYPKCTETKVEIHRYIPKVNGGKYSIDNCKPLCKPHHDLFTPQPWHR